MQNNNKTLMLNSENSIETLWKTPLETFARLDLKMKNLKWAPYNE